MNPLLLLEHRNHQHRANLSQWALALVSVGLCVALTSDRVPTSLKTALAVGCLSTSVAASVSSREFWKLSNKDEDAEDLSHDAWQTYVYKGLRSAEVVSEAQEEISEATEVPRFSWEELRFTDRHPVIVLVAPMGSGKTRVVKFFARILDAQIDIHDIYGRPQEWEGCKLFTTYEDMASRMEQDNQAVEREIAQYREGRDEFPGRITVLEEGVATIGVLSADKTAKPIVEQWLRLYTTVTRKLNRRLILTSVFLQGQDMGLGAKGRNTATIIFPGKAGCALALKDQTMLKLGTGQFKEVREGLERAIASLERPALVYHQGTWYAASIPELDESGVVKGSNPGPYLTPEGPKVCDLEKEIADMKAELGIEPGPSELGQKILDWLEENPGPWKPWQLTQKIRAAKESGVDSTRAALLELVQLGLVQATADGYL